MRPLAALIFATAVAGAGLAGCTRSPVGDPGRVATGAAAITPAPHFAVAEVTRGLEHGWDFAFLPDGKILLTERGGHLKLVSSGMPGATVTEVRADLADVYATGESGLMGLVLHPDFASSREFTTCQSRKEQGNPVDIRLVTWRLSQDGSSATRLRDLLTGLPVADGGRHSGCRMVVAADGSLFVGTGDTAKAAIPQDRTSLGGKVLHLDLATGEPAPDNPWIDANNPDQRYVWSYGHRNIQGIAIRPGTDQLVTAEHGPSFDDEVNVIRRGANYGWDPSKGGESTAYDESVPMTDTERFPDAVPAVWESGETTQAVCAATFLSGQQWGAFDGALVVTALKGSKLLLLTLDADGAVRSVAIPTETNGPFGRLRAARQGPDGALYVTTTNGEDDALLRITVDA